MRSKKVAKRRPAKLVVKKKAAADAKSSKGEVSPTQAARTTRAIIESRESTTTIAINNWVELVKRAVETREADVIRDLRAKADRYDLPIDLANACDDDEQEKALDKAFKEMNKSLDKRIKSIDPASDLSFELCSLRDMICAS